ncbi:hypothetical protein [Halorarum salinum]|uniref:Uncharacterized protein n=1 Tax=Halorarum salinum TaxID=2743089 RepID=A0A7D5LB89_9EURY|nr:hypothetical protein [Halobaculum salinum]QLG62653.1 hypothetical protein HUG12_13330 [Halobaculum salinum]
MAGCGNPDDEDGDGGDDGGGDDAYDRDEPKQLGPREGFGSRDGVRDGVHVPDLVDGWAHDSHFFVRSLRSSSQFRFA